MATPWEVDTAVYADKFKYVGPTTGYTYDVVFNSDGTKMYIVSNIDRIYQYTLSTAWDVSTSSYDSKYYDASAREGSLYGIAFKSDGTKMYIVGGENDVVYQYYFSTPWDISTVHYDYRLLNVKPQDTYPYDVTFSSNGTKMYIVGDTNNTVFQYTLSTAWDVGTGSYAKLKDVGNQDFNPRSVTFSSNGTKMYIMGYYNDTVYQYTLSTPWEVDTAVYEDKFKYVGDEDAGPYSVAFNSNGTKMYIMGYATKTVYQYSLPAPPAPPTNVDATDGDHTDKVVITWAKSDGATDYQVYRNATPLGWIGDVATYDDTGAAAPTITHGSVTASDGTSTAHVALSNTGASANNGTTHTYKVRAKNAAGESGDSGTNTGYRGVGALTYQWYRSNVDGDSGYGSIGGATASTYNDTNAPAGSVPGTPTGLTATDGVHTDKVALTWVNVSGSAGAGRYYKCYHTATGATPGYSPVDRGYRKAYTSTNTQVKRDITELGAIGSLATSYNDTGADAPTITVGTASASDGTSLDYVTLSIAGESANNGTTHDYYVRTYNTAGWGSYCSTNTGYRDVGTLTYQWQRSSGDSDADYSNIDEGTTDPYNDTGAPADGSGRYYKCIENATGAAEETTNADRGYRISAVNALFFGSNF